MSSKRKQWHPFFSNTLKKLFEPKGFRVETEVEIGELPLKVDIVVIKKEKDADTKSLPLVFQSFTDYNILEYKSPDDRFGIDDFDKLFAYALLYKIKEKIKLRKQINVYALICGAIKGIEDYIQKNGHRLVKIKDGLYFADFGFNFYLIQLDRLDLVPENYRLILFTSGETIQNLIKGIVCGDKEGFLDVIEMGLYLHPEEFKKGVNLMPETLADRPDIMMELVDIVGLDKLVQWTGEERVIHSIGEERVIHTIGEERMIHSIGEERMIHSIGEEKVLKNLIKSLGKEKIRKMLEDGN